MNTRSDKVAEAGDPDATAAVSGKAPLRGLRIADFTWIGAGAYTTRMLADLGADVIKIESRSHLDSLRDSKPFQGGIRGVNRSGYFADRNASKRSITLNLKTPAARELALTLIDQCDMVANNFTPGTMEKFGLGYEEIAARRPDMIYLAMSMHGAAGPEAKYLGYGLTMGAVTGLHYLSGYPDREPAGTGTNYPDHVPNPTHATFAVLAALRHRRRTGEGQLIDLAQIEPTIALLGASVLDFTCNGRVTERIGNQHEAVAPCGVYPCAGTERWIAIVADTEAAWHALTEVLGRPAWRDDPRFRSTLARWQHRRELDAAIGAISAGWDAGALMQCLQAQGVAAGILNDAADMLWRDPQMAHRRHWVSLEHPEMGRTSYGAMPFRLSDADIAPHRAAPQLGQHTEEICRELLGLDAVEIERLRNEQVLC
jgi:benzylsuccinate CoA-transferase BbsF subunit